MLLQSLKIFLTDSIGVFGELGVLGVLGNRGIRVLGNFYIAIYYIAHYEISSFGLLGIG